MTSERLEGLQRHYGKQFNTPFSISLKHGYLYTQAPYVVTRALDSRLLEWELRGCQVRWESEKENLAVNGAVHVKPYQLPPEMLEDVFFTGPFFRFAFVRDPFVRILTAFLDHIQRKQPPAKLVFVHFGLDPNDPDSRVDFAQFLEFLEATASNKRRWNPAWRPMAAALRPEVITYDIIGRMERFDEDIERINARLGGGLTLGGITASQGDEAGQHLSDHYTETQRDKVRDLYARDFARFRYAKHAKAERK